MNRPSLWSGCYVAVGILVWISFVQTNHDGLANVGLILYVFPVSLVGMLLGYLFNGGEFPLIPSSLGYLVGHAVFYFPSLALMAMLIAWLARKALK